MSRTTRRGTSKSPITRYLEFNASTGVFSYYDKDKKESVEISSLDIIVLDLRKSITGFNPKIKGQITSNMVSDTVSEELNVVCWKAGQKTDIASGVYQDIKSKVKDAGGKFTTNIICLADVGFGEEVCNIQLKGSTLNSWINFTNKIGDNAVYDNKITIEKGILSKTDGDEVVPVTKKEEEELDKKLKKNPRMRIPVWYYTLDCSCEALTDDESDRADESDKVLVAYFKSFETNTETGKETVAEEPEQEDSLPDVPEDPESESKDDLPF